MSTEYKRLYRSRSDRMFSGLCAGLGQYLGIDPTVIRAIVALGCIFAFPLTEIAYLIMMLVVPEEPVAEPKVEVIQS